MPGHVPRSFFFSSTTKTEEIKILLNQKCSSRNDSMIALSRDVRAESVVSIDDIITMVCCFEFELLSLSFSFSFIFVSFHFINRPLPVFL